MTKRSFALYENDADKNINLDNAVKKIKENSDEPKLIIFCSENMNFGWYSGKLNENFPKTTVLGSATYMNITSDGYGLFGLSVLCIYDDIEVTSGVILDVDCYPLKYAANVEKALEGISDYENTICFEFITSMLKCEEIVLDTLKSVLDEKNIPVIGSSSAPTTENFVTAVSLNGKVYQAGCVFAIIHNLKGRVFLYKENMYKPTINRLVATDVDCEERIVYEFDNRPAAMALSDKLNVSLSELPKVLNVHPLGKLVDEDIFMVDIEGVEGDGAIRCNARIYNRTKIAILESENIKKVWNNTREAVKKSGVKADFGIVVNCRTRSDAFLSQGVFEDFCDVLKDECNSFIGCSGMGEQLELEHLNQTMLLAIFE